MKNLIYFVLISLFFISCVAGPPFTENSSSRHYINGVKTIKGDQFGTCFPSTLAMVLNFYGDMVNKDEIAGQIQKISGGSSIKDGTQFLEIRKYKYTFFKYQGSDNQTLKNYISMDYPIIMPGQYANIPGLHVVVVRGYDDEKKVFFVNDSNKYGVTKMSYSEFDWFCEGAGSWGLVIFPKNNRSTIQGTSGVSHK
jgi:ABC-type bacteriocin/lantibiotic exporter with double-glycine peptidase domain